MKHNQYEVRPEGQYFGIYYKDFAWESSYLSRGSAEAMTAILNKKLIDPNPKVREYFTPKPYREN